MSEDNKIPPPRDSRDRPKPPPPRAKNTFSHQASGTKSGPGQKSDTESPFDEILKSTVEQTQKRTQSALSSIANEEKQAVQEEGSRRAPPERKDSREEPKPLEERIYKATLQRTKDSKTTKHTGETAETAEGKGKDAEQRVIGRQGPSRHSHEGQGGGQKSGGQGGFSHERGQGFQVVPQQLVEKKKMAATHQSLFGMPSQTDSVRGKTMMQTQQVPQALPEAILQQIVQYCRIVTRTDGDKEMVMKLRDEIFRGMDIRIALVKGKIEATFTTDHPDVQRLFNAEKGKIIKALAEKSIDVRQINVILA